jgi:copper chaperone
METRTYTVPGMHCAHCEASITEEVSLVPGVSSVLVDLETKRVDVSGESLDDAAIRDAIEEAGYEAA